MKQQLLTPHTWTFFTSINHKNQACESLFSSHRSSHTAPVVLMFGISLENSPLCAVSMRTALENHPANDKLMMKRPRKLLKLDFNHLQHINRKLSLFNHFSLFYKVQSNRGRATGSCCYSTLTSYVWTLWSNSETRNTFYWEPRYRTSGRVERVTTNQLRQ